MAQKYVLGVDKVQSGVTLAHRFTLTSREDFDLEGATRWRARDGRLRRDVTAYVIAAEHGSDVTAAVARVATVRDPRLARVIAGGTDSSHPSPVPYIVVERANGVALDKTLERRDLPPRLAGAIVGAIARALVPLSSRGVHHGAVRASAISVTRDGVPVLSGLGIDGVLRGPQAGAVALSEDRDAEDLIHLYVQCLTGLHAGEATAADLPDGLAEAPRALSAKVLDEGEPISLSDIVEAFAPDHGALRGFAGAVASLPLRADVAQAEMRQTFGRPATDIVSPDALSTAGREAAVTQAAAHAAPALRPEVMRGRLASVAAALPVEAPAPEPEPATEVVEEPVAPPLPVAEVPEAERDLFDDLAAYDAMVDEQNAGPSRSAWEAMVEPLHRRWPRSQALARVYESAHARAGRPGPLRTRVLLLVLALVAVVLAWNFALGLLEEPITTDMDRRNPPPNSYPAFTYGPSPSAEAG